MAEPETTPEVTPEPVPETSLIEQYELGEDTEPAIPPAPEPAPEPTSPAPVSHPRHLVQMAQDFGIPEEQIKTYSTDQLGDIVYHVQRATLNTAREQQRQQANLSVTEPTLANRQPTPEPPPEDGFTLTPEDEQAFDPRIVQALRHVTTQAEKIKALEQRLEQVTQREVARERETFTQHVDRRFGERPDVFGEGDVSRMRSGSAELYKRRAVLALVENMKDERGSFDEKFDRAVEAIYGKRPGTPVQEPAAPPGRALPPRNPENGRFTAEQWAAAGVARPTQRGGGEEPPGDAKALRGVAQKIRDLGLTEDADLPDDAFPE